MAIPLQLEEKIRGKVNDEFKEQVTLQSERDIFMGFAFYYSANGLTEIRPPVSFLPVSTFCCESSKAVARHRF
jgi:hypothetical protein